MHKLMLAEVIKACNQRQKDGDYPTVPAFPVEKLEDAVCELSDALGSAQRIITNQLNTIAGQLNTIKALTAGCEAYGLDGSTPVVVHLARQDERIVELERAVAGMEMEKQMAIYCQPRDVLPAPFWWLMFDDNDRGPCKYESYGAAIDAFDAAQERGWNCYLMVTEKRIGQPAEEAK